MDHSEIDKLEQMLRGRPKALATAQRRAAYDALGTLFPPAPDVRMQPVIAGGVPAEWTTTDAADGQSVLIYLHGGGYVYGSLDSHRHLASELGRAAGAKALALDYRRAPEAPFPAALDDALAAYKWLLDGGTPAHSIALAGDSAGAGLAVCLMVRLRELGLPQPTCAFLMSPWTDMKAAGESFNCNAARDPVVSREIILFCAQQYLGEGAADTPLASPIRADLRGIAPLTIFVGSTETMLDDSVQLARAAGLVDVPVRLEIWPGMFHIWPTYHQMLGEGRRALGVAGGIIRQALDRGAA